jgi:hypothetical protein
MLPMDEMGDDGVEGVPACEVDANTVTILTVLSLFLCQDTDS